MTATLTAAYCLLFKKNAVQIQTNCGFYLQIRCDGEFFSANFFLIRNSTEIIQIGLRFSRIIIRSKPSCFLWTNVDQ